VRVYAGAVAVASGGVGLGAGGKERREVEGPREVTREEWEHIVERESQIVISADGTASPPEKFDPATEAEDGWVQWNRKRDAAKR
jgi:hypothetical protein